MQQKKRAYHNNRNGNKSLQNQFNKTDHKKRALQNVKSSSLDISYTSCLNHLIALSCYDIFAQQNHNGDGDIYSSHLGVDYRISKHNHKAYKCCQPARENKQSSKSDAVQLLSKRHLISASVPTQILTRVLKYFASLHRGRSHTWSSSVTLPHLLLY